MAALPTTTVRIDPDIRAQAAVVFDQLGLSTSAAINAFLKAVVRTGGIPFEMRLASASAPKRVNNAALNRAGNVRKDEFYTQYEDVAAELVNYGEKFRDKVVFCNCDDPVQSAFVKFFVRHFNEFGIKKVIATSYAGSSLAWEGASSRASSPAQRAVITKVNDQKVLLSDATIDWNQLSSLRGNSFGTLREDGDFRSGECLELLEEADVVATNPPFSLFREYVNQLMAYNKDFVILGNMNATTYKEVFPLFSGNTVWYGETIRSGDRKFHVPDTYPLDAAGCGVDEAGRRYIRVKGVRWFTNLDNGRRHERLELNAKFHSLFYPRYENYDAIEVSRVADIPVDYDGLMGVPITFLDKFCPDQFEIIMLANGNARTNVPAETLSKVGYRPHSLDKGGVGIIENERTYARILIRKKV